MTGERRWRDQLDDYWEGTIWQRIVQYRQMWKQHAEAFANHGTLWLHNDNDDDDDDSITYYYMASTMKFHITAFREVITLKII